jgi:hypothetical protein
MLFLCYDILKMIKMKKTLLFTILMLVIAISAQAQETVTVKFTAATETGGYSPFTSVLVTDLTHGWTTTLAYPDTALVLSQSGVGLGEWQGRDFNMGSAYPNPFKDMTTVPLELSETSNVTLQVFRADGSVVASRDICLDPGIHNVTVQLSTSGMAFLSMTTPHGRSVARLVCTDHGDADAVKVECMAANAVSNVSRGDAPTKDDAPGPFEPGDIMRYEAFLIAGGTTSHSAVVEQAQYTSETVTLYFPVEAPEGAIDGLFTINDDGEKVYFSMGNLQYDKTTGEWSFMLHQYDLVEDLGQDVGSDYADQDIVSLFGWSSSGYNHGAHCYQPWSTSVDYNDYHAYGNHDYNLNEQSGQADWGYNAISNGGNIEHQWRTLNTKEWNYIFTTRTTSSNIRFAKAQVGGVNGVILLPDDWNGGYYSLNYPNITNVYFDCNIITLEQWATIEQHGAVFLPTAGYRLGTEILNTESSGHYWSASHYYDSRAYCVSIFDSGLYPQAVDFIFNGFSVRLVQVAH